ncbi:hypothetical protein F2P45_27885 [Massilia sp. CCM 8733]|uniref:Uncharacterized protein n=1 Tax=Massilia mucilaginosa TaxID=2609282 RepID=A0ABX0P0J4_9BURK|nr:hypothetical protein [Massilia mucilaginosa]NHZ92799.1 hypothetical protein [Massilia mucilaginosa]
MSSTVIKRLCAAVVFAALSAVAGAAESNHPPKFVQDPILGLRLPVANLKLDPVSEEIRALCVQMADNENWTARQWTFGEAKSADATYYLASGYFKRWHPQRGQRRYLQPDDGGVYQVAGGKCNGDPARETFAVRDARQIPHEVLQQLAADLVARLERAAGGPERLRAEIKKQRIDLHKLSPELREAFKSYAAPVK